MTVPVWLRPVLARTSISNRLGVSFTRIDRLALVGPPEGEWLFVLSVHGVSAPGVVSHFDAVVVGAGFAGLTMLFRLREIGLSVRVIERGSGVGGTWFWNRYPGARVDVPSMHYSLAIDPNLEQDWNWPETFSAQADLERYANHIADRFHLRSDIQFDTSTRWPTSPCSSRPTPGTSGPTFPASLAYSCPMSAASVTTEPSATRLSKKTMPALPSPDLTGGHPRQVWRRPLPEQKPGRKLRMLCCHVWATN